MEDNLVNKILIIGGTGMGKSTLAKNLGKQFNLPVYHLDAIHFEKNWKERDAKERDRIIIEKINQPQWIIDGLYKTTLDQTIKKADLVIILWFSRITQLKGIFRRHYQNRGRERSDIPGCIDKLDFKFIKFTLKFKKNNKSVIKEILKNNNQRKIIFFKSQKKLNKWYESKFDKKIM